MKYVKMLGLLAVAAAALMAFAGTASATLTDGSGNEVMTLSAKSIGKTSLTGTINVSCEESTVHGHVKTPHGADHVESEGELTTLTFHKCTHTVSVIKPGTLTATDGGANSTTATVFSTGARVTVLTHSALIGTVHCFYETNNTHIGTLTESDHDPPGEAGPSTAAILHAVSQPIPLDDPPSDFGCGNHATWEGTYEVTSPTHLYID